MSRTQEDVERYILNSQIPHEQVGAGTWVLRDPHWSGAQIVVHWADTLVVFRCKLFDVPTMSAAAEVALFRHLLQLNASEMLQGAYALENGSVIATECLQCENLDENEFVAALDSLTLAIVDHHDGLTALLPKVSAPAAA